MLFSLNLACYLGCILLFELFKVYIAKEWKKFSDTSGSLDTRVSLIGPGDLKDMLRVKLKKKMSNEASLKVKYNVNNLLCFIHLFEWIEIPPLSITEFDLSSISASGFTPLMISRSSFHAQSR